MSKHPRCLSCRKASKTKFCSPECDRAFKLTELAFSKQKTIEEVTKEHDWRKAARSNSVLSQRVPYHEYGF